MKARRLVSDSQLSLFELFVRRPRTTLPPELNPADPLRVARDRVIASVDRQPDDHPLDAATRLRALWRRSAPGWSAAWGVPDLTGLVRVEVSTRMRSSLGGFWPTEKLIRITDVLFEAPPHLLEEVLCHEAAHAAAHLLHGERVRSHGREWKELMRKAGLAPRVRIPTQELGGAAQRAARKRWLWEHRCPVCRAHRLAGRPVRQWRCGPCRAAGRHGRLVITRRPASVVRQS